MFAAADENWLRREEKWRAAAGPASRWYWMVVGRRLEEVEEKMPAPIYPALTPGLIRITQSTLEDYLRCGIAWELKRGSKVHHATVRMLVGSGVAAGAAHDNRQKIERGTPATLSQIVEAAVVEYETESGSCDVPASTSEIAGGKDDTAAAAGAFGTQVSPQLPDVLMAETPLLATVRGIQLAGTPDVVTAEGIGDLKCGKPWTQERADKSRQLSAYTLLHRVHRGSWPRRVWIDSLSHRRGAWHAERIWSSRGAADCEAFLAVVARAVEGMRAGIALPAAEGSWWCSNVYCSFWGRCPAVTR